MPAGSVSCPGSNPDVRPVWQETNSISIVESALFTANTHVKAWTVESSSKGTSPVSHWFLLKSGYWINLSEPSIGLSLGNRADEARRPIVVYSSRSIAAKAESLLHTPVLHWSISNLNRAGSCLTGTVASLSSSKKQCRNSPSTSLIAIAMNCTGIQSLCTHGCNGLSSYELRYYEYKSVSDLWAVLLSITDVPAPEQHNDDGPHLLPEEAWKEESDWLWKQELVGTPSISCCNCIL